MAAYFTQTVHADQSNQHKKYAFYIYKLLREIPNTAPTLFVIFFDAVIFISSSKQPISPLKFSRVIRFMQKEMKRDIRA